MDPWPSVIAYLLSCLASDLTDLRRYLLQGEYESVLSTQKQLIILSIILLSVIAYLLSCLASDFFIVRLF